MFEIKMSFKDFTICIFVILLSILPACSKKKQKSLENMDYKELKAQAMSSIEGKNKFKAIGSFEGILEKYASNPDASNCQIMLANLYFEKKNYDLADKHYEKLIEIYHQTMYSKL